MNKQASTSTREQRESAWRDRLARFVSRGKMVEAFCRDEAVSTATFYRWRTCLRARDDGGSTMTGAPFIDLGSMPYIGVDGAKSHGASPASRLIPAANLRPEERATPAGARRHASVTGRIVRRRARCAPPNKKSRIAAHEREHKPKRPTDNADESTLFFDDTKVPVEIIAMPNPETEGFSPDDYDVIGENVSHRLAQRPGSYVVLRAEFPRIYGLRRPALGCSVRHRARPSRAALRVRSRADDRGVARLALTCP